MNLDLTRARRDRKENQLGMSKLSQMVSPHITEIHQHLPIGLLPISHSNVCIFLMNF